MSAATSRLGIMTADQFKNRTKASTSVCGFSSHFKSRGSDMVEVDRALARWDLLHSGGKTGMAEQSRLVALADLRGACRRYLADKATKASALSAHRKAVVQEVLRACEAAESFVGKRAGTNAAGGPGATKGLEPGYAHERAQYTHFAKHSNPYSGTSMHEKQLDPAAMTLGGFVATGANSEVQRVEFMKRDERLQHLLMIRDGLLYQGGEPYDCPTKTGTGFVAIRAATFAMDRYGNLFSKPTAEASKENLRFNHSTYLAGKEVVCAGTLACKDGHLLKITNLSGHYRPDAAALRRALIMIGAEGVNLNDVAVDGFACVVGDGYARATTFVLTGPRAPADWPHPYAGGPAEACKVDHAGQQYQVWEPA
jgi:hypothetical protein